MPLNFTLFTPELAADVVTLDNHIQIESDVAVTEE